MAKLFYTSFRPDKQKKSKNNQENNRYVLIRLENVGIDLHPVNLTHNCFIFKTCKRHLNKWHTQ